MSSDWQPDWRVHPGEHLREAIEALGITQHEFADRLGVTQPFVSQIVNGHKGIGPWTALKLEAAGAGPAQFWLNLQLHYDLHRVRETEAQKARPGHVSWCVLGDHAAGTTCDWRATGASE